MALAPLSLASVSNPFDHPLSWIDGDDLHDFIHAENDSDHFRSLIQRHFGDYTVNRPTQMGAFSKGIRAALSQSGFLKLPTRRQLQAIRAERIAHDRGDEHPIQYVAHALDISIRQAYHLLHEGWECLDTVHNSTHFAIEDPVYPLTPIEQIEINKRLGAARACAGAGRPEVDLEKPGQELVHVIACSGTAPGGRVLCWPCRQVYGAPWEWPLWLKQQAADLQREARIDAIETIRNVQFSFDM